ncbi:MAG: tripartite tricarboxylate transporter substrate binding protein [Alphaproteobacteria bacterium]|nr:tripartite tricarboxylate transporter substrate binding protein [Alphaproteobacteria bacterium]
MGLHKTTVVKFLAGAAFAAALASAAQAQTYPTQAIRFVTGFPPGSGADVVTRFIAEQVKQLAKVNTIVENRVGAAGNIAQQTVARSKPDGYTILMSTATATASSMYLYKQPPVDVGKELRIGATINRQGFMIVVDKNSPHKTLADLTAALKAKGDKASYGVAAPSGIVLAEVYRALIGAPAVQVRFRTASDSLKEMASGALEFASIDPQVGLSQSRAGNIRILGVSTGERLKAMPDVPTMKEGGFKDFDQTGWWAMIIPAATPDSVVEVMDGWMKTILAKPETVKFFADAGADAWYLPARDAQKRFLQEIINWSEYMRMANIPRQ